MRLKEIKKSILCTYHSRYYERVGMFRAAICEDGVKNKYLVFSFVSFGMGEKYTFPLETWATDLYKSVHHPGIRRMLFHRAGRLFSQKVKNKPEPSWISRSGASCPPVLGKIRGMVERMPW